MAYITTYSGDMYHHGIKGQKWGVRRFQNEDGTLTSEGKARYGEHGENLKSESGKHYDTAVKSLKKGIRYDIGSIGIAMATGIAGGALAVAAPAVAIGLTYVGTMAAYGTGIAGTYNKGKAVVNAFRSDRERRMASNLN